MTIERTIQTLWFPNENLIETQLKGDITQEDVKYWKSTLAKAFSQIGQGTRFKILIDLYGFKAVDLATHKLYREIIPLLLADYNWKVGYVDLFEEAKDMKFSSLLGITCIAAAHVHQDEEKINKYQERFSRENEQFFTDPLKARAWIYAR
ncbi:hypothetical protein QWY31_11775 [Cytophagales bacterium LB-30]|uniref:STAS/SEC14 domain-containing protein n=1 Tax=Shiella aurantiaca TaxID=3058365 RepID=A0ABT8F6R3_9BACT|nr:hypothetical protein [Shiella aurantiaca]MDN4166186.1 hypothetical protein [Shiella aurantiaca]